MRASAVAFVIIASLAMPRSAFAFDNTVIQPPKGAPLAIAACNTAFNPNTNIVSLTLAVTNLNAYKNLERVTVRLSVYDDIHARVADERLSVASMNVEPGETARFNGSGNDQVNAVALTTCQIISATFDGGAVWTPSKHWTGKLVKAKTYASTSNGNDSAMSRGTSAQPPAPSLSITKTGRFWNEVSNGSGYIHVEVVLTANTPTTVNESNMRLTIAYASGATQTLGGINGATPSIAKANALTGASGSSPMVASSEDMGALGTFTMSPGTPVRTVVTFYAPGMTSGSVEVRDVTLAMK